MIARDDLRAAVAAGILSEAQAASLASLADVRRGARENLAPGDEPFELFKGFNEIFIVVGLVILAMGWFAVGSILIRPETGGLIRQAVMLALAGAVLIWLLSEYFIRRRRMVAPAIALSVLWALNALGGFAAALSEPFMIGQEDYQSLPLPTALATLAICVYWLRFRVPFAMAMIALGAFAVALIWTAAGAGTPETPMDIFLLSGDGPFAWVTLAIGIAVFAGAMIFDMSDPHRVTRRAANGFWLHVIAAPALVNTVALTLFQQDTNTGYAVLAGFLLFFAIVAVIIDRRSFLIAAVGYCVALSSTVFDGDGAGYGILILGLTLVLLGATWERLRAVLLRGFAPVLPLHRLPPSA
ncbi:hypothetical protein [Aestuariivita sp.]|jgi:hypothetical protein|uniref:hypothetical protein n=1 Tax=Aestuariivita sp. TaxID=1872407 RepID=UPI00216F0EAE|nr:hypothetical protein [Aestuariivita sp.]MCE8005529.1 hypothetical protein [Aestuariivita sp.]